MVMQDHFSARSFFLLFMQFAFCRFSGSEVHAGLGNGCERLCASRSLLGSYVHQELTDVNNTNVFCCVIFAVLNSVLQK